MPEIAQITTTFGGFPGAPGYNNLYFFGDPMSPSSVDSAVTAVKSFWANLAPNMCSGWTYSVGADVNILDPATGDLLRVQAATTAGSGASGTSGAYAGGVGACASIATGAVHGKKRLRGRIFIVPLLGDKYDTDGTLSTAARNNIQTHLTTLCAVANFGIWGRPRDADPTATPPVTALTGLWAGAQAGTVKDKTAILRSRRD